MQWTATEFRFDIYGRFADLDVPRTSEQVQCAMCTVNQPLQAVHHQIILIEPNP